MNSASLEFPKRSIMIFWAPTDVQAMPAQRDTWRNLRVTWAWMSVLSRSRFLFLKLWAGESDSWLRLLQPVSEIETMRLISFIYRKFLSMWTNFSLTLIGFSGVRSGRLW